MPHSRWLVLMDIDHIQEYIFSTNRLKEIRGASLLLEKLNRDDCHRLLSQYDGRRVFIGGGGVLATFPDESQARSYVTEVQAKFHKQTHIATITGVIVPLPDGADEQDVLRQARLELRLAKESRSLAQPLLAAPDPSVDSLHSTVLAGTQPLLTSSYFRLCQSCNRHPVVDERDGDEICEACAAKRDMDREKFPNYSGYVRLARRFADPEYGNPDQRWLGLEDVPAKLDRLEGRDTDHIGFIHADVNDLGAFLETQTSLSDIEKLGATVERTVEEALMDAVHKVRLEPKHQCWPFLIIILGGDDVTLIVPARRAVPLANQLCLSFEEKIKQVLGEITNDHGQKVGQLALSAGVVVSKPKHPAYALADLAEGLTKSAKRLSHELKVAGHGPVPTLDFQVIHTPTANPIEEAREEEYFDERSGQEYWYTSRPLPCRSVTAWPDVSTILEIIGKLRSSGFPRNKLNDWADLIYTSEIEQILGWQTLQTRLAGESHQALVEVIQKLNLTRERVFAQPAGIGEPYVTPLLDLIELYDFAQVPEQKHD